MSRYLSLLFFILANALSLPAVAENWFAGFGTDISRGKYGQTTETEVRVDYLQLRYAVDDLLFRLDLPYLHIQGPANVILASDGDVVVADARSARQKTAGWGDVTVGVSRVLFKGDNAQWALDLGGRVKLPTANAEQGLGTGKTDYILHVDFYFTESRFTYFASAGYKWMGRPEGTTYRDSGFVSLGATYKVANGLVFGTVMDYRQAVVATQQDPLELMLFVTRELGSGWRAQIYLYGGTNHASPERGGGISIGRRF